MTPRVETSGRTTQKLASSSMKGATSSVTRTETSTFPRPSVKLTASTCPTVTSR